MIDLARVIRERRDRATFLGLNRRDAVTMENEVDGLLAERERLLARIAEMAGERRTLAAERDRLADALAWSEWWLEREEEKVPGTCPECGLWAGAPPGHPFPPPYWWLGCLLCWWDFQRGLI